MLALRRDQNRDMAPGGACPPSWTRWTGAPVRSRAAASSRFRVRRSVLWAITPRPSPLRRAVSIAAKRGRPCLLADWTSTYSVDTSMPWRVA